MATSGTYNFGNTVSDQLIKEAFERVPVITSTITGEQVDSAKRTINLLLSEWMNRGLNLWTVSPTLIGLNPNQGSYYLNQNTSDILFAAVRTSTRQLGGTPAASSGVAANAFDGNTATACTQTAPNGNISYDYGAGALKTITMFGVQSAGNLTYTLNFEYSYDNVAWVVGETIISQEYPIGQILWFNVPVPVAARAYRIREVGGATLNISELYFNNTASDTQLTEISITDYAALPQKNQSGRPSSYWFNRQIRPTINLWPVPTSQYNTLYLIRTVMMQDVNQLTDLVEIPQRFYEALVSSAAHKLSLKTPNIPLDRLQMMERLAQKSFDFAAAEDTQEIPLTVAGDYSSGWGG